MSNSSPTTKRTFWELLNQDNFRVQIPIIQRDYAQGRKEQQVVRDSFLNSILEALGKSVPLELDFVYGNTVWDEGTEILQLLDGQQRLTTLFLLHWYAAWKENFAEQDVCTKLKKFTYETRVSTREFCVALVDRGISDRGIVFVEQQDKSKHQIIDTSWFHESWKRDPSINSMLTMLSAIHFKFDNVENLWQKLCEENLISFFLLKISDFGLSDDLYIKMNARGLELTLFEKFKSLLYKKLTTNLGFSDAEVYGLDGLAHKIDTKWTDFLWSFNKNKIPDDLFLFVFFRLTYICHEVMGSYGKEHASLRNGHKLKPNEIPLLLEVMAHDRTAIDLITKIFDYWSENGTDKLKVTHQMLMNEVETQKPLFNEQVAVSNLLSFTDIRFADLTLYYGYIIFACKIQSGKSEHSTFGEWIRVVKNLTQGSIMTYYNSEDEFRRSVNSVSELLECSDNILISLANGDFEIKSGFWGGQIEEELLKAKLMVASVDWRKAILKAESNHYFNGQVGFLLDFAGVELVGAQLKFKHGEEESLEMFNRYFILSNELFDSTGLAHSFRQEHLFRRALLAKGDYLPRIGWNYTFIAYKGDDRDNSWKRFLRDKLRNGKDQRSIFKLLLDDVIDRKRSEPDLSTSGALKAIITESKINDWRKHFVHFPEILDLLGEAGFVRWPEDNNDDYVLLLKTSSTNGYHFDYQTYALYMCVKAELGESICHCYPQRSIKEPKYLTISRGNGAEVLNVTYVPKPESKLSGFKLVFENGTQGVEKFISTFEATKDFISEWFHTDGPASAGRGQTAEVDDDV